MPHSTALDNHQLLSVVQCNYTYTEATVLSTWLTSCKPYVLRKRTCPKLTLSLLQVLLRSILLSSFVLFITALHGMQTRSSDENSVCLSVCQTRDLWQNGRKIGPDFHIIRKIIYPSFLKKKNGWWNFWSTGPRLSEIADFQPIFADSSSAVTPSEKSSINTNRKSTTRFAMSLRWPSYVALSPEGGSKRKTADFRLKSHFPWRKSATKFLCVKTVSGKVVRHALLNDWWCRPLLPEILDQTDRVGAKSPIFSLFSLIATQP